MTLDFNAYGRMADTLKALAHPVRLCIVHQLLLGEQHPNVTEMKDCLDLPQPTVSQHLQKLRAAGIVEAERRGLEVRYRLRDEAAGKWLSALFAEHPAGRAGRPAGHSAGRR